jgi:hypothetical protein
MFIGILFLVYVLVIILGPIIASVLVKHERTKSSLNEEDFTNFLLPFLCWPMIVISFVFWPIEFIIEEIIKKIFKIKNKGEKNE